MKVCVRYALKKSVIPARAGRASARLLMRLKAPYSSFIKHCYALAVLCVCAVGVCNAQQSLTGASGLRVLVTDSQQRALAGAACSLRSSSDNATVAASATSDEQGIAAFPANLKPGNYTLSVESQGFETFNRNDVVIKVGAVTEITVSLKVAGVTESVTIAAPAEEA